MRLLIILAFVACCACKKEKNDQPAVSKSSITLHYIPDQLNKSSLNWFSVADGKGYSFEAVNSNPSLQKQVAFGFYSTAGDYGLLSKADFPMFKYGVADYWIHDNYTAFRTTKVTAQEIAEKELKQPKAMPDYIEQTWIAGYNHRTTLKKVSTGDVFAFISLAENTKGLIVITMVDKDHKAISFDCWLSKAP